MFNWEVIIMGLIRVGVSLLAGILFIFVTYGLVKLGTTKIDDVAEMKKNNLAVGLFMASNLFAVCYVIHSAMEHAMNALSSIIHRQGGFPDSLYIIGIMLMQLGIAGALSLGAVFLGVVLFNLITPGIDIMDGIRQNNLSIAVVVAVIIIALAVFIEPGVNTMLSGFIPYPAVETTL